LNHPPACGQLGHDVIRRLSAVCLSILLAAGIAAAIIGASHFFGQRARKNRIQDTAYECGIDGGGLAHARFSVKFYVIALLFVLFDIEVIFLVPWTFVYREFLAHGVPILPRFWFSWACSRSASAMK